MDKVLIAWNLPNWITVLLMVAAGWLVVGLIYQVIGAGQSTAIGQWFGPPGTPNAPYASPQATANIAPG